MLDALRELGTVGLGICVLAVLIYLWMVADARRVSGVGKNPNVQDDDEES